MQQLEAQDGAKVAGVGMAFKKCGADIVVTGLSNVGSAAKSQRLGAGSIVTKVGLETLLGEIVPKKGRRAPSSMCLLITWYVLSCFAG
jgi:hypothetical protein